MNTILLLLALSFFEGSLFLVKCFLGAFCITAGFGLANRWFKAIPRGPTGMTGEPGRSCECDICRDK